MLTTMNDLSKGASMYWLTDQLFWFISQYFSSCLGYVAWLVDDEMVMTYFKVLSQHLPRETMENHENSGQ